MRRAAGAGAFANRVPAALAWALLAFAIAWVAHKAFGAGFSTTGNVPTFIPVLLNGISLGGLYFITAAGFTLIFGLMRVVNMAHGSLYLFGGYLAFELAGGGMSWWLALVLAALGSAAVGLVMQQLFLRWNGGQDLRQALITIAVAIILADQMLVHFGAQPETLTAPGKLGTSISLGVYDLQYPLFRLFVIGAAVVVALALYALIKHTRLGMVIRAGVDDRAMTSALGVNVQLVFAVAFLLGAALAGMGGVFGGTMLSLAPGEDDKFLLSSLVVVIIGGLGSLPGAAVGALLLGLVEQLSAVYLPSGYTNYSILLTFVLLIVVLAVRPAGLFGRVQQQRGAAAAVPVRIPPGSPSRRRVLATRVAVAIALVVVALVPVIFSTYFTSAVGSKALYLGLAAASLTFLAGDGGMVSLAQTAVFGIAGFVLARFIAYSGMDPVLAALAAIGIAVAIGALFGAISSGSEGIYLLMITLAFGVITYLFFDAVPSFGAHEGINGVTAPGFIGNPVLHPTAIYYVTLVCSVAVWLLVRHLRGTPFGMALRGVRDDPVRMRALGYNIRLHRTLGFAVGAFIAALAGVLGTWHETRISPETINVAQTIELLTVAVIGGLYRLEGAWIGALVFTVLDVYTRGLTDRFETWIGVVFLLIVLVSPDGITGLWASASERGRRLRGLTVARRTAPPTPDAPDRESAPLVP